jgi:hypothetical protein
MNYITHSTGIFALADHHVMTANNLIPSAMYGFVPNKHLMNSVAYCSVQGKVSID